MTFFGEYRGNQAQHRYSAMLAAEGVEGPDPHEHGGHDEHGSDVAHATEHGHDHGDGHGAHASDHGHAHVPHESPWTMVLPLILLCGLAMVAGALNLPFTDSTKLLEHWLEPVLEFVSPRGALVPTEAHIDVATGVKVALAVVAVAVALAGIALAAQVYLRRKVKAVEPEVLARGWYYDETITAFMGGPGRAGFETVADIDAEVVDGAVHGVGALARKAGTGLRRAQTGYVRNYALGLAIGAVVLVGLLVGRGV